MRPKTSVCLVLRCLEGFQYLHKDTIINNYLSLYLPFHLLLILFKEGYTSISVREPLARILGRRGDPHYATVSDDSDEMYAAIEERNTSGSETYAQISPPVAPPNILPLVLQHQQSIGLYHILQSLFTSPYLCDLVDFSSYWMIFPI